mmetsp:Transcript_4945/g.7330  ORF Transcript_4945/g.7330 Transcript_4945/m.7330 type:complete len:192 (-) Transcript_4945:33-608(-)
MYSWVQRLNSILTAAGTVLGVMSLCVALSSLFLDVSEREVMNASSFQKLYKLTSLDTNNDQALMYLNIDFDLSPLFHWNTKQCFIYITASYDTDEDRHSGIVIWDKIVRYNEPKNFSSVVFNKYPLIDMGDNLRGRELTFTLSWETTPFVGLMYGQRSSTNFTHTLPDKYSKLTVLERSARNRLNTEYPDY